MASKIQLRSSTKNFLKFFALTLLLTTTSAYASGHGDAAPAEGGGHGEEHAKPKEKEGNFSKSDLDEMKQDQLLTFLSSTNYQSSEYAVYYFEQKGEAGIPALLKYLKKHDDEDKIVSAVIYTLGRVGPNAARAVPLMMKFLYSENSDIRKTTISALGKIGKASEPAVPEIAKSLDDKNEWTHTTSLRSLKDIGTPQAKAIASLYEKKLQLEQERKNRELLANGKDDKKDVVATTDEKRSDEKKPEAASPPQPSN